MKKKLLVLFLTGALAAGSMSSITALADSQKVVTLGADLTEDQKTAILKYFGILGDSSVLTLTITNQDERNHLASYVPIEQIGTKTFSCALVNPTTSGGIQVKTANLNWVTGNMIATNLSTAGVKNCEVLAASPFEVSGTGALTGVIMAYEQATGTTLDENKKELATMELVTTGEVADEIGQTTATNIVNEIKIQIIEGRVVDTAEVEEIVYEVVESSSAANEVSEEVLNALTDLAEQIAEMEYDYEDMKDTLERVAENTSGETSITINNVIENNNTNTNDNSSSTGDTTVNVSSDSTSTSDSDASASADSSSDTDADVSADSILNNTDTSALGVDIIVTDTLEPETEQDTSDTAAALSDEAADSGIVITTSDEYTDESADTPESEYFSTNDTTDTPESEYVFTDNTSDTPESEYVSTDNTADMPESEYVYAEDNAAEQSEDAVQQDEGGYTFTISDEYTYSDDTSDDAAQDADSSLETAEEGSAEIDAAGEDEASDEGSDGFEGTASVLTFTQTPEIEADTTTGIVTVYLPKNKVSLTSGTLIVSDLYSNILSVLDVQTDADHIAATEMTAEQLFDLGWSEGTAVLFHTGSIYGSYVDYTFSFIGTAADVDDPTLIGDVTAQGSISTEDLDTGVMILLNNMEDLKTGHIINGYYNLGESYSYAEVTEADSAYVSVQELDGGFNLTLLQAGTTEVTVTFYDEEGSTMERTFEITILEG